jgi:hypothetical protein
MDPDPEHLVPDIWGNFNQSLAKTRGALFSVFRNFFWNEIFVRFENFLQVADGESTLYSMYGALPEFSKSKDYGPNKNLIRIRLNPCAEMDTDPYQAIKNVERNLVLKFLKK